MRSNALAGLLAAALALALAPVPALAALVVNAGEDVTLECESPDGTEYTLNGRVRTDAPDPRIRVHWTTDRGVDLTDPESLTPTGTFPPGDTIAELTADDSNSDDADSDAVTVTVRDTNPPVARAFPHPFVLWPPNHEMVEIEVRLRVRDACTDRRGLRVELISVASNEPDNGTGDGNTVNDIQGADIGTDDRHLLLRAERKGNGSGRVYTIVYQVSDPDGNTTEVAAKVHVPHDASDLKDLLGNHHGNGGDMSPICPTPEQAVEEFTDAHFPSLGSSVTRRICLASCRAWSRGCRRMARGAARCLSLEIRAVRAVENVECRNNDNGREIRACLGDLRDGVRRLKHDLREEHRESNQTCISGGRRCSNACFDLFDRQNRAFDGD